MPTMRAKLYVSSVTPYGDPVVQENISFHGVTSKPFGPNGENEDNTYARYSPMANLNLTVANPALLGTLKPGQTFYVDFIPAE